MLISSVKQYFTEDGNISNKLLLGMVTSSEIQHNTGDGSIVRKDISFR